MEGKTAVVTGSTSGIGLGIAHHLASKGCNVVLTGLADQTVIDDLIKDFKRYMVFNGTRLSRSEMQFLVRVSISSIHFTSEHTLLSILVESHNCFTFLL